MTNKTNGVHVSRLIAIAVASALAPSIQFATAEVPPPPAPPSHMAQPQPQPQPSKSTVAGSQNAPTKPADAQAQSAAAGKGANPVAPAINPGQPGDAVSALRLRAASAVANPNAGSEPKKLAPVAPAVVEAAPVPVKKACDCTDSSDVKPKHNPKKRARKKVAVAKPAATTAAAAEPKFVDVKPVERDIDNQQSEIAVSDREMNTFVFDMPVVDTLAPNGAAFAGKPLYLPGHKTVILQLPRGSSSRVQVLFVFEDGSSRQVYLKPKPIPGVMWTDKGSQKQATRSYAEEPTQSADVRILQRLVQDERSIGDQFTKIPLPAQAMFTDYTLVPTGAWYDGESRRLFRFAVVAKPGHTALLSEPQFYRDGIKVVMLDGQLTDAEHTPSLYVIEAVTSAD